MSEFEMPEQVADEREGDSPDAAPMPDFAELLRHLRPDGIGGDGDDGDELTFASVADATAAVANIPVASALSELGRQRLGIARWVVAHADEISYDCNDWHTFCTCFLNQDPRPALEIAETALRYFPYDITLLGDAIQSASELADWERGDVYLDRALSLDPRYVTDWYLPTWVSMYFRMKARSVGSGQRQELLGRALSFLRTMKRHLPYEDRIINQEAEILIEMNDLAEARRLLDEAIFEPHQNGEGVNCRYMLPQCCLTYLDQILGNTDEYDRIIQVANAGIQMSGTKERSTSVSYFIYRLALAKDCKIHAASTSSASGYGNPELVRDALSNYALAYSLRISENHKSIIAERFHILTVMSGISDIRLDQYCKDEESGS